MIRWELFASIAVCLLLTYFSLRKKSFFSEKIRYVLSIIPFFVFAAFLFRVLLLEGSYDGIHYFFTPNLQVRDFFGFDHFEFGIVARSELLQKKIEQNCILPGIYTNRLFTTLGSRK